MQAVCQFPCSHSARDGKKMRACRHIVNCLNLCTQTAASKADKL
jgi:hypothetical protein